MNKYNNFLLVAIVFLGLIGFVYSLSCGRVYNGPHAAQNRKIQHSLDTMQFNWDDFDQGTSNNDIDYAYAIISMNETTTAIRESGPNAPTDKRCRDDSGLDRNVQPDVVDFRFGEVSHNTAVKISKLRLHRGFTYYVIIRATQGDDTTYSNSEGIEVVKHDDDDDLAPYQQGLIAMGCAIFCLLCLFYLLLLLLCLVFKGKGDDKYTTTVHRNENVEKV